MGLPSLILESELVTTWRVVLEGNGLKVSLDLDEIDKESRIAAKIAAPQRVARRDETPKHDVTPWLVLDESSTIGILETAPRVQTEPRVFLVFTTISPSRAERQLFSRVESILIASGAAKR
jgi:hypothetical protein